MAFDWNEYLELAKALLQQKNEAAQRSAISRAYYAAFCLAQRKIDRQDPEPAEDRDAGSHEIVWRFFRNSRSVAMKKLGEDGFRLKRLRRRADYKDEFIGLEAHASDSIRLAEAILRHLRSV